MNKPMTNAENQEHNKQIVDKYNAKPNIIEIRKNNPPREVIRIAPDGKLFWNEREVETDDDFRSAMLDLAESLKQPTDLIRQQQAEMNNKPVAWMDYLEHSNVYDLNVSGRGIPLYTHPTKTTLSRMEVYELAIDSGFMLSTQYGQAENKLMPVSDGDTLVKLAKAILRKAQE